MLLNRYLGLTNLTRVVTHVPNPNKRLNEWTVTLKSWIPVLPTVGIVFEIIIYQWECEDMDKLSSDEYWYILSLL
jgi:hypothetical protein